MRHVAQNHGGNVVVDSREGDGSTFVLELPMNPVVGKKSNTEPTKRMHVLVVEDEESFVDALSIGLDREGFDVSVARDGQEALNIFSDKKFDLVLLDLMLPKLSGLDVCRSIRNLSDVPIIIVSAKGEEVDMVLMLEIGADDYVTKPYRLRELVARMRAVLRRREVHEQSRPPGRSDRTRTYSHGRRCPSMFRER